MSYTLFSNSAIYIYTPCCLKLRILELSCPVQAFDVICTNHVKIVPPVGCIKTNKQRNKQDNKCDFNRNYVHRVCLATWHLHFWQNDQDHFRDTGAGTDKEIMVWRRESCRRSCLDFRSTVRRSTTELFPLARAYLVEDIH